VDVLAHLIFFFGLHLIIIKPIGDPLGLGWASREARPVLMQSLS